jgi:hypothetical protein
MPDSTTKPVCAYRLGLKKNRANFSALLPFSAIAKAAAAAVYPDRIARSHGERRICRAATDARCRRLVATLLLRGVKAGDMVAVIVPNVPVARANQGKSGVHDSPPHRRHFSGSDQQVARPRRH